MECIQMVDLAGQNTRIRSEIDQAIKRVVDSTTFIGGAEVERFAEELADEIGCKYVIPCANGTDALQIALMALGVGPGDEVITPAFTFISTVEVVALLGAIPVLVDVDERTFNINCAEVEAAITSNTRAIVPVHLFGQCADLGELVAISERHGVPIVEDTAQSLMGVWANSGKAGTFGAIGTTSFFPSKNLGCFGDGGALFTNNEALAQSARQIANHGGSKRYLHEKVGMNSRLDSIQAAILRVKLKHLSEYNEARLEAANRYDHLLKDIEGVEIPFRDEMSTHVFHQYTLKIDEGRDDIASALKEDGIPTGVYYPRPIHFQPAFSGLGYVKGDFPVSEIICDKVLSLPMHTEISEAQQKFIVERLEVHVKASRKTIEKKI